MTLEIIGDAFMWLAYITGTGCCLFFGLVAFRYARLRWRQFAEDCAEDYTQYRAQQAWRLRAARHQVKQMDSDIREIARRHGGA